jgi:4-hydroxy-tetrahydrodipicolinate reductase
MLKLIVCGACGRMGRRIIACAAQDKDIRVVGAIEAKGHPNAGNDAGRNAGVKELAVPVSVDLEAVAKIGDAIVDFSTHAASVNHAKIAAAVRRPVVIGTTGMSASEMDEIRKASKAVACLVAPNMSVGVNLLFKVAGDVARSLGDDYDVEIIEAHHRLKKDAPSGTAKRLAESVARALGRDIGRDAVYGREGETGERPRGQIGIHAVRQGDIVGEHLVSFACAGERVELGHKAHSRDTFARGALRAAKWIVDRPPGLYDMMDVLNIR